MSNNRINLHLQEGSKGVHLTRGLTLCEEHSVVQTTPNPS